MLTKGAIGNLVNRYRAVLKKCRLMNIFGTLAVTAMLIAGGMVCPVSAQEGVTDILNDYVWEKDSVYNNHALVGDSNTVNFNIKNGSSLSFNTELNYDVKFFYPKKDNTTVGSTVILANNGGNINIKGETGENDKHSTININHEYNNMYKSGSMASEGVSHYAIVSYNKNSILDINNINLNLNHVAGGIVAGEGGSIVIKNTSIDITSDHFEGLQHHAITAQDGSHVDITSNDVILKVSGISYEVNDPLTVFSSGIHTTYGGNINIVAEDSLSVTVETKNENVDKAQNYGVYALDDVVKRF